MGGYGVVATGVIFGASVEGVKLHIGHQCGRVLSRSGGCISRVCDWSHLSTIIASFSGLQLCEHGSGMDANMEGML